MRINSAGTGEYSRGGFKMMMRTKKVGELWKERFQGKLRSQLTMVVVGDQKLTRK